MTDLPATYYSFHPETGEYLGPVRRQPNTISGPANSTELQPPEKTDTQTPVFREGVWSLVEDNRGTEFWTDDGEKHVVANLGETVPEDAFLSEPINLIGTVYWLPSGEEITINKAGVEPPANALSEKPDTRTDNEKQEAFIEAVRQEVERRIFAYASRNTQSNMNGEATRFNESDLAAFHSGLDWINAMRSKGRELVVQGDQSFLDDSHWPEPPADAVALAERF